MKLKKLIKEKHELPLTAQDGFVQVCCESMIVVEEEEQILKKEFEFNFILYIILYPISLGLQRKSRILLDQSYNERYDNNTV